MTAQEFADDRLELISRLAAIVAEIDAGEAEDVARTLAESLGEDIVEMLVEETNSWAPLSSQSSLHTRRWK